MRIATWNVNSLRARLEKVLWWLERARPDVLLMQETKLADVDVPAEAFRDAGYELAHHGEGRWNGVAIASRCGIAGVVTNFGVRIDHLLATRPVAERTVWSEIDREARKGKPIPSDHAPLVIDVGEPGCPFDAGWQSAEGRIAGRRARPG